MKRLLWVVGLALAVVGGGASPAGAASVPHWARTYQVNENTWGIAIQRTGDGGSIIAGNVGEILPAVQRLTPLSPCHFLVMKLEADGAVAWQRVYGQRSYIAQATCVQEIERSYFVAGYVLYDSQPASLVMRLDSAGQIKWARLYASKLYRTIPVAMVASGDGGVVLAGVVEPIPGVPRSALGNGPQQRDFWLFKVDSQGVLKWSRAYDSHTNTDETAISLVRRAGRQPGFVVAGTWRRAPHDDEIWLLEVDAAGTPLHGAYYLGEKGDEYAGGVALAANGDIILTGFTNQETPNGRDIFVLRVRLGGATKGQLVWGNVYQLADPGLAYSHAVFETALGSIVVAGSGPAESRAQDGLLLSLQPDGALGFARAYGGTGDDDFRCAAVAASPELVPGRPEYTILLSGYNRSFAPLGVMNLWAMNLDRYGLIDAAYDSSCLIHEATVGEVIPLTWSASCQTDLKLSSPKFATIPIKSPSAAFGSTPVILCNEWKP